MNEKVDTCILIEDSRPSIGLDNGLRRIGDKPLSEPMLNRFTDAYMRVYRGDHDDVIKWKHFPRNWPFVRRIPRSPVNSPHKGQWRGALMFTLICARINGWVSTREAGDLRRYRPHFDVIVMISYVGRSHRSLVLRIALSLCFAFITWSVSVWRNLVRHFALRHMVQVKLQEITNSWRNLGEHMSSLVVIMHILHVWHISVPSHLQSPW